VVEYCEIVRKGGRPDNNFVIAHCSPRKTLGDRHRHTLKSICTMGELLHAMSQLKMARLMLEEALRGQKETLGDNHQHTRKTIGLLDKLLKLERSS
jgi:hypothetical protein